MEYLILLVGVSSRSLQSLSSCIKLNQFRVMYAKTLGEATERVQKYWPHLIIVQIDPTNRKSGLAWLEKLKSGPGQFIHTVIISTSPISDDVKRARKIGLDDYMVISSDAESLSKKLLKFNDKAKTAPLYKVQLKAGQDIKTKLVTRANVTGLSETGICFGSDIISLKPFHSVSYTSDFFLRIGDRFTPNDPPVSRMLTHLFRRS